MALTKWNYNCTGVFIIITIQEVTSTSNYNLSSNRTLKMGALQSYGYKVEIVIVNCRSSKCSEWDYLKNQQNHKLCWEWNQELHFVLTVFKNRSSLFQNHAYSFDTVNLQETTVSLYYRFHCTFWQGAVW